MLFSCGQFSQRAWIRGWSEDTQYSCLAFGQIVSTARHLLTFLWNFPLKLAVTHLYLGDSYSENLTLIVFSFESPRVRRHTWPRRVWTDPSVESHLLPPVWSVGTRSISDRNNFRYTPLPERKLHNSAMTALIYCPVPITKTITNQSATCIQKCTSLPGERA